MILDKEKVSELLADNKEENKMEHEYKSNNTYVMPSNRDDEFFKYLFAWGLVDGNNRKTGANASSEQVAHLATSLGITSSEVTGKLDRLQISTCEQTGVLKDAVHTSSIENLVGQNALGEKITNVGYMANNNTKDIEKTILLDGGTTRANSDAGFVNLKDSVYALSTKTSAEHCDIKGLMKDNKYDLSLQATMHQSTLMAELAKMESNNALRDRDAVIRDKDDKIQEQQFRSLKEDNVEIKKLIHHEHHGRGNGANIDILSDNFSRNIGSAIGNSINSRIDRFEDSVERKLIAFGNNINFGSGNAGDKG